MNILKFISFLVWNSQERRLRALWRILLQLLIFLVLSGIPGALVATVILLVTHGFKSLSISGVPFAWLQVTSAMVSLIAILLSLLIAGKVMDRRPFADFGFHLGRNWWVDLGFGLALGAFLMFLIFGIEYIAGWVRVEGRYQSNIDGLTFPVGLALSVVLFLCVGIYEEALSRGYHLRNFAEGLAFPTLSAKKALILGWLFSSVVFGVLHLANPGASLLSTVNITVAGLLLGLGFVLTGELAIPIGLHITWNFFQGNVFGFPVSGTTPLASFLAIEQSGPALFTGGVFGPEAGLVGLFAMLVGGVLIVLWVQRRYGSAVLQERLAAYMPGARTHEAAATVAEASSSESS